MRPWLVGLGRRAAVAVGAGAVLGACGARSDVLTPGEVGEPGAYAGDFDGTWRSTVATTNDGVLQGDVEHQVWRVRATDGGGIAAQLLEANDPAGVRQVLESHTELPDGGRGDLCTLRADARPNAAVLVPDQACIGTTRDDAYTLEDRYHDGTLRIDGDRLTLTAHFTLTWFHDPPAAPSTAELVGTFVGVRR